MHPQLTTYIWLAQAMRFGGVRLARILRECPDIEAFVDMPDKAARFQLVWRQLARLQRTAPEDYLPLAEECTRRGIQLVCWADQAYPEKLRHLPDPPAVLYCMGDLSALEQPCVAIVGTREIEDYPAGVTYRIACALARRGVTVVSGCAGGADTFAHKGALQTGRTAAVLGTSLEKNYPASNRGLKRQILKQGGLLLSEYPPGTTTQTSFFPQRNRLVMGLSDAVAVTQAPASSGALITARLAAEAGVPLFCLPPADIENPSYAGVIPLLREGALPLLGAEDILQALRETPKAGRLSAAAGQPAPSVRAEQTALSPPPAPKPERLPDMSPDASKLYAALDSPRSMDESARRSGLPTPRLLAALTELELFGLARRVGSRISRSDS